MAIFGTFLPCQTQVYRSSSLTQPPGIHMANTPITGSTGLWDLHPALSLSPGPARPQAGPARAAHVPRAERQERHPPPVTFRTHVPAEENTFPTFYARLFRGAQNSLS
jgi:hypothetical protein